MQKYRVRLLSGRVIGPFDKIEYKDIEVDEQLTGDELCQTFPSGEWKKLKNCELYKSMNKVKEDHPLEFEYEINDDVTDVGIDDFDKTIVKKRSNNSIDEDKTVLNEDYQLYLKQQKKIQIEEEKKKKEIELKKSQKDVEVIIDYKNEQTQFIKTDDLKNDLDAAFKAEVELKKEEKKELRKQQSEKIEKKDIDVEKVKKSKMPFLILLAGILLFIVYYVPEPDPKIGFKKIVPLEIRIIFPPRENKVDKNLSNRYYNKGLEQLKKSESYFSEAKSLKFFRKSLGLNYSNTRAAAKIILIYSKALNNSKNYFEDSTTLYNLVQYFESKSFKDHSLATSIALFFTKIKKYNAALNIVERYLDLKPKNISLELYSVYLLALSNTGNLFEAEKIAQIIKKQKTKKFFVLKTLHKFYKEQNLHEEALNILKVFQSSARLSNSVYFLLEKGDLFAREGDTKETYKILRKINQLKAEGSREYYSRYLKLFGLYWAGKKENDKALSFFKKSLEEYKHDSFTMELASINPDGNDLLKSLVDESKIKVLLKKARNILDENINEAFKIAIIASEINPRNIETQILLSEIQIRKGYYDDALKSIESLFKENRSDFALRLKLIDLYIKTFRFSKAEDILFKVENQKDWRYLTLRARLYNYKKEYNSSVKWLIKAINKNQLNEENIYDLALMYIRFHKYSKAKSTLNKLMRFDPKNVKYKILYAKILYEVETASSAIGYLYDVMKEFKNNAKILSEIGIYYYKSGQIKNYENILKKLEALDLKDSTIFQFLLESAKLDDNYKRMIKYSQKILEINPGDSSVRLFLAKILISYGADEKDKKRKEQLYIKAKLQLDEIRKRFSSYPRLNFYEAKLFLVINEIDKALELAKKEFVENPTIEAGPLLLGDIYMEKKELLEARKYYLKALQINSKSVDALMGLALIAFESDQFDLSLDQYKKVLSIDPYKAKAYRMLGDLFRKLGQTQPAIENYKQFLELSPNSGYKNKIKTYIRKTE